MNLSYFDVNTTEQIMIKLCIYIGKCQKKISYYDFTNSSFFSAQ